MGLFVQRNGGLVQLTSTDICYQLAGVGSALLTDSGETRPQPVVRGRVSVSGVNPILAFRAAEGAAVSITAVEASGGSVTYHLHCTSSAPIGVIYWVFDVAGSAGRQISGPRVEAWTELGVKTFDSAAFLMKLSPTGSGPDVAVIQSMYEYRQSNTDLGVYSESENGQETLPPEPGGGPPPGATHYRNRGEGFQSAARFHPDGSIETGVLRFEVFDSWQPIQGGPILGSQGGGRSAHTFIDVAGLPRASMPSQQALAVSVSTALREVTVSASAATTTTTPSVTASVSGGTPPYTFEWGRVAANADVAANGPATSATFSTRSEQQPPGTVYEAEWRPRAQDANGVVGFGPHVTFRHIVTLRDVSLDPVNWTDINWSTTANVGSGANSYQAMAGITEAVTLRVTISGYTGNMAGRQLLIDSEQRGNRGGFSTIQNGSFDLQVQPGERLYFYADGSTDSGVRTYDFTVTVTNLSDNNALVDTFKVSGRADSDNNHNVVDTSLDPINWGNISINTNSHTGSAATASLRMSGISQNVTLRATISGFSGSIDGGNFVPASNSRGSLANRPSTGNGSVDFTVQPNEDIYFFIDAGTNAGRKSASFTVTIRNVSDGNAVIDTFTVNITVDADNNYNVLDYSIDPLHFSDLNISGSTFGNAATAARRIRGGNQPVTLYFDVGNYQGSIAGGNVVLATNQRGSRVGISSTGPGGAHASVDQGEDVYFYIDAGTAAGTPASASFYTWVYNASDNYAYLGGFQTRINLTG